MNLVIESIADPATCARLLREVFIDEQGVPPEIEQDGRDGEAHHLLARLDGRPVGCARTPVKGVTGRIGRVCVLPGFRGRGIGRALIEASLAHLRGLGLSRAGLGAQTQAMGLYEACGFEAFGPVFEDGGGIPHRMMRRRP